MSRGVGKSRKWSSDAHFPKVIHNFFHKKQRSGGKYFFAWATGHISYVKSRFHGNTKAPPFGAFVLSSSCLLRPVSSGSQGPQVPWPGPRSRLWRVNAGGGLRRRRRNA